MGGAEVIWSVRKKEFVALSSTVAEFVGLCTLVKETVWILWLVDGLEIVSILKDATTIHTDNQGQLHFLIMGW